MIFLGQYRRPVAVLSGTLERQTRLQESEIAAQSPDFLCVLCLFSALLRAYFMLSSFPQDYTKINFPKQ